MKKILPALLFFSFISLFNRISAQNNTLKGSVVEQNSPVQSVNIQIVNTNRIERSDSMGRFGFNNLPMGPIELKFARLGYQDKIVKLTVRSGINYINVELLADAIEIKGISITGNKQPNNMISQIDMQLRPLSSSQDLLRMVPGLFIAQHAGGGKAEQIFLRGFDVDHGTDFAIYVDGIPVNMTSHAHGQGYADLHFLIPETVKELEVNKGPHATNYGDLATAGSGEFRTLNNLNKNLVKFELGMFDSKRVLAMFNLLNNKHLFSKQNENLYVAGEYKYTNSYFQSKQHFNRFNIFTKYTGKLNNGDFLTLSLSTFQSQWDASGQIPDRKVNDATISRFGSIDPTEGGKTGRTNFNIIHERKWKQTSLKNQFFYSRYDFNLYSNFTFYLHDSINGDQIQQVDHRNVLGYNSTLINTKTLFERTLTSIIGVGVRYDNSEIQLNKTVKRELLSQKVFGKLNQINTWLYADETLQLNSKLKLNLGTRFDVYNFDFKDYLVDSASGIAVKAIASPKVNLTYSANKSFQLFAKSGFGFHSNDARAVVVGKLENTLARAFGNELGTTFKPFKKLLVNIAFWSLDLQSELVYVGDEGIVEATGRTRRIGIDIGLRYQLNKHLFFDVDINRNNGWLRDEPKDARNIPLAPTFTSIGGITYKNKTGFNGSFRYRYMGDRAAIEDNSIVAKGYFLTDAVLNYSFKKLQLGVSVENLFNTKWKEAQFATESRLKDESAPINEIHFTPGTPLFVKLNFTFFL
ncbi:MAG: TonB-dependent receptor [bacterium]|nr:TonB-dependent receptor [bacterium]